MTLDWPSAVRLVSDAQHIVIVTHIKPDGDAIGSLLGLMWALRRLGKQAIPAVDGGVPDFLRFLPGAADVQVTWALHEPDNTVPDLLIAVDCGDESRMGEVGAAVIRNGLPLINLDHHVTNTLFGQVNLVDSGTVAACEGIFDWLPHLGVDLDLPTATCLLTGLVTDTLCFRTSNVTGAVLGKVQRLMEVGAPLSEITQRTVMRKSWADLRLWSAVMPAIRLEDGIIWAVIDRATRQAVNYTDSSDGGLVSLLNSAQEAWIAVVFRETDDGRVEVGIRAVPGFNVSDAAVALGGGGHALAAGATVTGTLDAVVARALSLLRQAAQKGTPLVS